MCIERWRRGVQLEGNEMLVAVRLWKHAMSFDVDR